MSVKSEISPFAVGVVGLVIVLLLGLMIWRGVRASGGAADRSAAPIASSREAK